MTGQLSGTTARSSRAPAVNRRSFPLPAVLAPRAPHCCTPVPVPTPAHSTPRAARVRRSPR